MPILGKVLGVHPDDYDEWGTLNAQAFANRDFLGETRMYLSMGTTADLPRVKPGARDGLFLLGGRTHRHHKTPNCARQSFGATQRPREEASSD